MSGLRDKLERLKRNHSDKPKPVALQEDDSGWGTVGVALETNAWGAFLISRRSFALNYRHGRYELGELAELGHELGVFGGPLEAERLLFFDTETTGLGVGAGNVAFMIGLGYYEGAEFHIEQLLIRNPAEEAAMLAYFNSLLSRFTHLVTYNGRTFDWPILKNRYVLHRMKLAHGQIRQLDFLYASRSLWRHTQSSCRLGQIEEKRLGFTRKDDTPGSLAPSLYFEYLANKRLEVLQGVFVHNEQDILSLAGLAIHLSRILGGKLHIEPMEAEDRYRTGLWLDKMGKSELAEQLFSHLLETSPSGRGSYAADLALHYKRRGDIRRAVQLWLEAVACAKDRAIAPLQPFLELAMYYEHRERDYAAALDYAEEALRQAQKRAALSRGNDSQAELCEQLRKRIDRLRHKNSRAIQKPAKTVRRRKKQAVEALTLF